MVELSGQGRFQIADGGGVQFFGLESQAPAQLQMRTFADQGGGESNTSMIGRWPSRFLSGQASSKGA